MFNLSHGVMSGYTNREDENGQRPKITRADDSRMPLLGCSLARLEMQEGWIHRVGTIHHILRVIQSLTPEE